MSAMKKSLTVAIGGLVIAGSLTGCWGKTDEVKAREALQAQSSKNGDSLELKNLKKKREREESADSIRYLYVMNFGQIVGYYVTKGKISSNGSQIAPEQDIIQVREGGERYVVDSAQDDGSFGVGDPGIFFFTTDDVMVVTSLDYIQSDQPLAVDVPRLGGSK